MSTFSLVLPFSINKPYSRFLVLEELNATANEVMTLEQHIIGTEVLVIPTAACKAGRESFMVCVYFCSGHLFPGQSGPPQGTRLRCTSGLS